MPSRMLNEPLLIGRKQELEQLHTFLSSVVNGKGKTVFLSGHAGSGKSRLVSEFLESTNEKETNVLKGFCLSNVAIPYFPFIEAFNRLYSESEEVNELPDDQHNEAHRKDSDASRELTINDWLKGPLENEMERKDSRSALVWKDLTFVAVTKALLSISEQKPIVFAIEDAHWADSASLSLLHYIARAISSSRILFLVTYRSEELNSDIDGRPHPLVEVLRLMGRESLFEEIKLTDLSSENVASIGENMLGGSLDADFAGRLSLESQGNPLFVVESLRMLFERGELVCDNNTWRLSIEELGVPSKIRDVILRRVGTLKSSQRRVLDVASVVGEVFDVEVLAAVTNQDTLEVLETLNAIAVTSSLVYCQGESYRFDHAMSREILYEEIPLPLKRGYHNKIAARLETASKDGKDFPVNELAYHFAQAGITAKAVKYSLAAGLDAVSRYGNAEAVKHFRFVLDTVAGPPESSERITALEGLGDALFARGLFEDAIKTYESLGDSTESSVIRLRALRKATEASRWRGDVLQSLDLAEKALQYKDADSLEYARVLMNKGLDFCLRGNAKEGLPEVEKALLSFEQQYALADTACALGQASAFGLSFSEFTIEKSLQMALRGVAIYEDLRDYRGQLETLHFLSTVFMNCGLFDHARQACEKGVRVGEEVADNNLISWLYLYYAISAEAENLEEFVPLSLRGLKYAEKTGTFYVTSMLYANLIRYYSKKGDLTQAQTNYEKLMRLFPDVERAGSKLAIAVGKRSLALYFAAIDKYPEANALMTDGLNLMSALHHKLFESMLRNDYSWILKRQGKEQEAKVQSDAAAELFNKLTRTFELVDFQGDMMFPNIVAAGQEFNLRLDISNISEKPGTLLRVKGLFPEQFTVTDSGSRLKFEDGSAVFDGKEIAPFGTETLTLKLCTSKPGSFNLNPEITYADSRGQLFTTKLKPTSLTVQSAATLETRFPGRVSTGYSDLDNMLLGGLPENYSIALTGPISDELEYIIDLFLRAGAKDHGSTFYLTTDSKKATLLQDQLPNDLYLLVCSSKAELSLKDQPNTFKLKGVENLTEIDIAILKTLRLLGQKSSGPRRACIEVVSDVLLQHHAVTTRKWLSGLIAELKSKGFSTIAVINSPMHPQEEVQAIMGIFDGELRLYEKESEEGTERMLRVARLHGQRYLSKGINVTKAMLT